MTKKIFHVTHQSSLFLVTLKHMKCNFYDVFEGFGPRKVSRSLPFGCSDRRTSLGDSSVSLGSRVVTVGPIFVHDKIILFSHFN